ncbi:MAG TPA: VWA domain-containing protein [Pyrinomonadaceae bacterium]
MKKTYTRQLLLICLSALLLQMSGLNAAAQQQSQTQAPPEQQEKTDDVVRITTELVQTDVSVFDKQGRFVDGLKKEDFELRVDGKPVAVNFFERVAAGTVNEEAQLAAARGGAQAKLKDAVEAKPLDRGRVVSFYIDDLHMAFDNLKRVKDTVTKYIEKEMGQNDLVAITSASGQVGFLQQFTDNKDVLRAALARITYRSFEVRDFQRPPMSAYQALLLERGDRDVSSYFVEETIRQNPGITTEMAQSIVSDRARNALNQMARTSGITLSTLESLVRSSAQLPGRKLIFFISDGFFLDSSRSDTLDRMRTIIDASARSGVVVYSMDSKGLVTSMPDASSDVPFDPSGRLSRATGGENSATQDVMNAIAVDTGGRMVRNTNVLDPGLTKALKETSLYYLLAWRPDAADAGRSKKFRRIEVGVKNRPELSVRVQRGYFDAKPEQKQKEKEKNAKDTTPADPLRKAIGAQFPQRGLPTQLALSYMDIPTSGSLLVATIKIEGSTLKLEQAGGKAAGIIDLAGVVIDAQGKQLDGFKERLTVIPNAVTTSQKVPDIRYNYRASLKPGLYQVRVAARDDASGQVGSATQWILIPDLSKQKLSMSSLIVGERKPGEAQEKKTETVVEGVPLSVDHRFERSSHLRFLVYIYNAARGASATAQPDVALQIQIFRDDQPVVTTPLRKLENEAQDFARLAYAAEIPLQTMSAGQYILQVTAIDRIAKTSASQRVRFEVQ